MTFKECYKQVSEVEKLKFLDAIIRENQELQTSFVHFIQPGSKDGLEVSYETFVEIIEKTRKEYIHHFETVDLENPDWDQYTPSHSGYIAEWEQCQEASEQELALIFEEFGVETIDLIITQDIDELTAMMIGLYLAARDAAMEDPLETFEDVNDYLLDLHQSTINHLNEKIKLSAVSDRVVMQAIELFFRYFSQKDSKKEQSVEFFEDYLIALAEKTSHPEQLLTQLDQTPFKRKRLPRLALLLIGMTGNPTEWVRFARAHYKDDREITNQLLEHFFENDQKEFLKLAIELYDRAPSYWASMLSPMITPELSADLFIKVHYRLVTGKQKIEEYLRIKPYLTQEKKEKLLKEIKHNLPFMVQVLEEEKRFKEIQQVVEQNMESWDYHKLIKPILTIYPEFCFNQIKKKVLTTIASERGRSVYQHIVELLQLADTIPGHHPQNRILALELYQIKPNLPALKDELRKGGLV